MMTEIRTLDDINEFVIQLIAEGLNYHPDDDFENYINIETGAPSYTTNDAFLRNQLNNQCFVVCESKGVDIYDISMEIFLKETGLEKFIPLPSQTNPQ